MNVEFIKRTASASSHLEALFEVSHVNLYAFRSPSGATVYHVPVVWYKCGHFAMSAFWPLEVRNEILAREIVNGLPPPCTEHFTAELEKAAG